MFASLITTIENVNKFIILNYLMKSINPSPLGRRLSSGYARENVLRENWEGAEKGLESLQTEMLIWFY